MVVLTTSVAPEYVSFYAAGSYDVEIPLAMQRSGVIGSAECLNIPCQYWNDGDTRITLGDATEIGGTGKPAYDGMLETPNHWIALFDANIPEILKIPVTSDITRVRVWINHPKEPDDVVIAVGDD